MKIGIAGDPFNRLAQLQTGSPHPLRMAWSTQVWGDAYQVEAEAHAMLDRHRIGGEWFAVPADVAVAAVSGATYRLQRPWKSTVVQTSQTRWFAIAMAISAALSPAWTLQVLKFDRIAPILMIISTFLVAFLLPIYVKPMPIGLRIWSKILILALVCPAAIGIMAGFAWR